MPLIRFSFFFILSAFAFVLPSLERSNQIFDLKRVQVDANQEEVRFSIKNFGLRVTGSFSDYKTEMELDSVTGELLSLKVFVAISSLDTGIKKRNQSLMEEKYFNQEKYPEMSFELIEMREAEEGSFKAKGHLQIKDVVKEVEIPLSLERDDHGLILQSRFVLNRLDYGGGGQFMVHWGTG